MTKIFNWVCRKCGIGVSTEVQEAPTCLECGMPMALHHTDTAP